MTNLICVKKLNFLNLTVKNLIQLLDYSIETKLNYSDKIFKETQKNMSNILQASSSVKF